PPAGGARALDGNRARGPGGPRTPRSRRVLPWPASPEETADGLGKLLPDRPPLAELAPTAPGDRIHAPPSPGIGRHPAPGQKPGLLEPMQHRVDCPFREIERAAAPALDLLDTGVAVGGARRQRGEHDHVEMSLEHFPFHAAPVLVAAELLLQPLEVDDVPVLGKLPVFDAPDVDGPQ